MLHACSLGEQDLGAGPMRTDPEKSEMRTQAGSVLPTVRTMGIIWKYPRRGLLIWN